MQNYKWNSAGQIIDICISIDSANKNNLFVEPATEHGKHWFQQYVSSGAIGCVFSSEGFQKFSVFCVEHKVIIGCK